MENIQIRPNLTDWKQRIDTSLVHEIEFESSIAQEFDETAYCEVCSLEKWCNAKFCWNESCPVSPIYYKLTGVDVPYGEKLIKQTNHKRTNSSNIDTTFNNNFSIKENIEATMNVTNEVKMMKESVVPSAMFNEPKSNIVNNYLLELPSKLIGTSQNLDIENNYTIGADIFAPLIPTTQEVSATSNLYLVDNSLALVKLSTTTDCNIQYSIQQQPSSSSLDISSSSSQKNQQLPQNDDLTSFHEYYNELPSTDNSILASTVQTLTDNNSLDISVFHSQYYYPDCKYRSDSFAETDCEVKSL